MVLQAMRIGLLAALAGVVLALPARALDLPTGKLPFHVDVKGQAQVTASTLLVIKGTVEADAPVTLVLRVDDDWSDGYASRVNEERIVPPGPFRWEVPLKGLKTSGGRLLRYDHLRGLHLFNASSQGKVRADVFRFEEAASLPDGAVGISLGSAQGALFPGFERLVPGDKRIEAGHPVAVTRPGVDPLIGNGMRGMERLHLPWPAGRATLTLWLEDVGEWETLPWVLRRRVRVNGRDIVDETFTPQQWIAERYMRGRDRRYRPGEDSWEAYGRHRGGEITTEVEVGNDGITIELAGAGPGATFMAAALIEPAGSRVARDAVTKWRRDWFVNAWPIDERAPKKPANLPVVAIDKPGKPATLKASAAPGTGQRVEFQTESDSDRADVPFAFQPDPANPAPLKAQLWSARWRLDRESTGVNLLQPSDRTLRGGLHLQARAGNGPTRHVLWLSTPPDAPAGRYRGTLVLGGDAAAPRLPVELEVLPVRLPESPKVSGFYLEPPVHLTWFEETHAEANRQLACDMRFLAGFGVTGNAPPLPAPVANRNGPLLWASQEALQNATTAPWLAYAAAKRSAAEAGVEGSAQAIADALAGLRKDGLPPPVWSVADEPSNPSPDGSPLAAWVAAIRAAAPSARLAGHLNARKDTRLLDLFDVVLLNDGYGLDVARLHGALGKSREVWLYNTGKPRFTAGFWLWRTAATRYLQWHARMPTADPFDPTDGREGDVQALLPMATACAATPDIDEAVLEMAEGVVDHRWLLWLDGQPSAAGVRFDLLRRFGAEWQGASSQPAAALDDMRRQLQGLARSLK